VSAAGWLIFGILIPCGLFLVAIGWIGVVKMWREQPQIAKESGWKRVGWGVYLTGPWGGPYREPSGEPADSAGDRRATHARLLLPFLMAVELLALGGGAWLAHALGRSVVAGALVGLLSLALLIGSVWIVRGAASLRRELRLPNRD
jgi:hypothetical protein